MRGTCVTMFQSLFESLLNHLFGEASLFNLRHLYLNYHLLAQKLFSLWKILPYLQALNHSGSFGKSFVKLKKKCYLPAKGRSVW